MDWRVKKKKKEQTRSLMLSVFSWGCKNMQRLLAPEQIESGQEDKALRRQITLHVSFNPSIYVSSAQVRIFPYLIGRESAFADNLKWMACANKGLGLFDKHFSRQLPIRASRTFWCGVSRRDMRLRMYRVCVVWLCVCVCVCVTCVSMCVCAGSDSFCQEAMKWHLGGVRGQSSLIPLPVRVSPPWLLAADGSHVSTLRMSALWKGKSQPGKQITEWLRGDEPQTSFPIQTPTVG